MANNVITSNGASSIVLFVSSGADGPAFAWAEVWQDGVVVAANSIKCNVPQGELDQNVVPNLFPRYPTMIKVTADGYQPVIRSINAAWPDPPVGSPVVQMSITLVKIFTTPGTGTVYIAPASSDHTTPLTALKIFVDGKEQTVDANNQAAVAVKINQTINIVCKADGFDNGVASVLISDLTGKKVIPVSMTPSLGQFPVTLTFVNGSSPAAGAQYGMSGRSADNSANTWAGTADANGIAHIDNVPKGLYEIIATSADAKLTVTYDPPEINADNKDIQVQLVAVSADDNSGIALTTAGRSIADGADDPDEGLLFGTIGDVSEQTYDNAAYQGYFTSAQCQMYIGDLFIDELAVIQYALQQNSVPVYGYCSEFIDAYARGRSIVQGQIVLNFVHQGYLYAALSRYGQFNSAELTQSDEAAKKIAARAEAASNPGSSNAVRLIAAASLTDMLKTAKVEDLQKAGILMKHRGSQDSFAANPLYLQKTFDIRLVIGDGKHQTVRFLEKVKLGANEQIIDARSGDVIADSYAFTARRLR